MPTALGGAVLDDEHRALLRDGSGLSDDVIDSRGYYSVPKAEIVRRVAAGEITAAGMAAKSAIAIPVIRPDGKRHCEILRLIGLPPTQDKLKYAWPTGRRNALDIHPRHTELAADPRVPLIITEGIKKGDAILSKALGIPICVVSINGCWGWVSAENGASRAAVDWRDIGLTEKRRVILVPDSDYALNPDVRKGWNELAKYLQSKAGETHVQIAPVPSRGLDKQGADDFLLNNTLDSLLALARHPDFVDEVTQSTILTPMGAGDIMDESDEDVAWVVDRLIPEKSVLVVAGHTSSYKTWHCLALGLDAAFGLRFLDHPDLTVPEPQRVLYINKEMGRRMIGARLKALIGSERYRGLLDDEEEFRKALNERLVFLDDAMIDLAQPEVVNSVVQTIQAYGITLTILDTLSMVWTGDENSARDVGNFYSTLRLISQLTGTSWVILHHLLKPSKEKVGNNPIFAVRGSGQIVQQADSAILLSLGDPSPDYTDIQIIHGKSRADRELPAFMTRFHYDPDSSVRRLEFTETVAQELEREAAVEQSVEDRVLAWMEQVCYDSPSLRGAGQRQTALADIFRAQWPENFERPSDRTLKRRIAALLERGCLEKEHYTYRIARPMAEALAAVEEDSD